MQITFIKDYREYKVGQIADVPEKLALRCIALHKAVGGGAVVKAKPVETASAEPVVDKAERAVEVDVPRQRGRKASRPKPDESDESDE